MQVVIVKDYHEMSRIAADMTLNQIRNKPSSVFAFPTGDTPGIFYSKLVEAFNKGKVDFSKIRVFNLDEYVGLAKHNKASYAFYMKSRFYSYVNVPDSSHFIPNGMAKNLKAECSAYEKKIQKVGGIDVAILGIGVNGHIGFNEPGAGFNCSCHVTKLTKSTLESNSRHFGSFDEMPKQSITMGLGTILKSGKIVLLATGPKKAKAIYQLVEGPVTKKFPASILQTHDDVTVIIDESAAVELKKKGYKDQKTSDFTIYHESSLPRDKKIVVVSPHPDDSAISLGGTIAMLSKHNDITTFVMTTGHRAFIPNKNRNERIKSRKKEAENEAKVLGTRCKFLSLGFYGRNKIEESDIKKIIKELNSANPDIIFLTSRDDLHPTHQMSTEIVEKAVKAYVKKTEKVVELWYYESPWSLFSPGAFNAIVQVAPKYMRKKLKAVCAHKSQIYRTPFDEVSKAMSVMRGALVPEQILGVYGKEPPKLEKHAEVFQVTRKTKKQKLVESFSGVRGIYGSDLNDEIAENYAYAYGLWLKEKTNVNPRVVIGRDSRPSGKSIMNSMIKGLERAHCHVLRVGIGTTPLIQLEVRKHNSHGGIIITASHNEPDWNGFKFLWSDGGLLKPKYMDVVIKKFHQVEPYVEQEIVDHYIQYVNETIGQKVIDKIRKAKLKVVVDPNGGAMIVLIKKLFEYMNIETVELNMDLGVFKHKVEPTKEALKHMGPIIDENNANLGVAWDCDGDRVEVVLPGGRHISGHYVLALLVDEVLSGKVKNKSVVVSTATSEIVHYVAKSHGAKVYETDIGEANVVGKMYKINAPVGGEGTCGGGIVPPSRCRDGVLTLFKILSLMVKKGMRLNEIVNTYPRRYTLHKNIRIENLDLSKLRKKILSFYKDKQIIKRGGSQGSVKVKLPLDAFIVFRVSKTEPSLLRIIVDSPTKTISEKVAHKALNLLG